MSEHRCAGWRARLIALLLVLSPAPAIAADDAADAAAARAVDAARLAAAVDDARGGSWRAVESSEWGQARALFAALLAGQDLATIRPGLDALGLEARALSLSDESLIVVQEREGARRGRGIYAFRRGDAPAVVLQAPHSRSDRGSGRIAAAWMANHEFRAAAWNTLSRDAMPSPRGASDLARLDTSYFTALTAAVMAQLADPVIVQVHGFARGKRRTRSGKRADAIVSSGRPTPDPAVLARAACLEEAFERVRIYGLDVDELGGTINPVGKRLRGNGSYGFVHLELAAETRSRLLDDPELTASTGRCLLGPPP